MAKRIQDVLAETPSQNDLPEIRYVETVEAYDKWAEVRTTDSIFPRLHIEIRKVYDTDGNFLQRLDTIEMRRILPWFLARVIEQFTTKGLAPESLHLLDLGCGTGRNTVHMLQAVMEGNVAPEVQLVGLDASPRMIEVAHRLMQSAMARITITEGPNVKLTLGMIDLLRPVSKTQLPVSLQSSGAMGVISTLVVEHIPLKEYFAAAATIMRPGAYLLLTNMHADMGAISQAGFKDPQTGVKIRPTSYSHSIPEVLAEATKAGFQKDDVIGAKGTNGILERRVDDYSGGVLGERAKKWVGVKVWFGLCFRKT